MFFKILVWLDDFFKMIWRLKNVCIYYIKIFFWILIMMYVKSVKEYICNKILFNCFFILVIFNDYGIFYSYNIYNYFRK